MELSDNLCDSVSKDVRNLLSNRLASEQEVNRMRFCPTFENLDAALKTIMGAMEGDQLTKTKLVNIWTLLHINAEPLVLQVSNILLKE